MQDTTAGTRSAELLQQLVDALVEKGMDSGDFTIDFMRYMAQIDACDVRAALISSIKPRP